MTMSRALRVLSAYTSAVVLFAVFVLPFFAEDGAGNLAPLPALVLAWMVLGGTGGTVRRVALWGCALYTSVIFVILPVQRLTPPLDPFDVVLASLYLPVAAFAGLVLVALRRNAI